MENGMIKSPNNIAKLIKDSHRLDELSDEEFEAWSAEVEQNPKKLVEMRAVSNLIQEVKRMRAELKVAKSEKQK